MPRFLSLIDGISRLLAGFAMAMLVILIADMIYEVVARRLFSNPTLWAYDVAYMLNGLGFLLAAGYTLRHNGHVRIDYLSSRLSPAAQDWINVIVYLFLLFPAICFVLIGAWNEFLEAYLNDELDPASSWKPLLWPLFLGILIGFSGLLLQMLAECIRHVRSLLGLGPSPLRVLDENTGHG